jgi:hypothetical protein
MKGNVPDPPTASGLREQDPLPQLPETPWTKSKRKRVVPRDITNHDDDNDDDDRNLDGNGGSVQPTTALDDPFTHSRQPSEHTRKAAKTCALSTPGQPFAERLKSCTVSLPTPNSRDHISADNIAASQPRLLQSPNTSPTPGRFNDTTSLNPDGESDLSTTVLELIRSDNLELKASTGL